MILWLFCENVTKQNVVDECEMYSKVKDMTYELLCVCCFMVFKNLLLDYLK